MWLLCAATAAQARRMRFAMLKRHTQQQHVSQQERTKCCCCAVRVVCARCGAHGLYKNMCMYCINTLHHDVYCNYSRASGQTEKPPLCASDVPATSNTHTKTAQLKCHSWEDIVPIRIMYTFANGKRISISWMPLLLWLCLCICLCSFAWKIWLNTARRNGTIRVISIFNAICMQSLSLSIV